MAKKIRTIYDFNQNEIWKVVLENLSSHPSTPKIGQIYFNTTDNLAYIWGGSSWQALSSGGTAKIYAYNEILN